MKQEPAALQKNYFLLSLRTHVHCFTGNVNTHSWFVKANVHLKNSFMVWLIQKQKIEQLPLSNFALTDGDGSYCKWGLHSLFASWRLHLRRCSMHVRTAIDMSVVALNLWRQDSLPWPDISINITLFVKPKIRRRFWQWYNRMICANIGKTLRKWHLLSSLKAFLQPAAADFVPELYQIF